MRSYATSEPVRNDDDAQAAEPVAERVLRTLHKAADGGLGPSLRELLAHGTVSLSDLRLDAALRAANLYERRARGEAHNQTVAPAVLLQELIDDLTALIMEDGLTGLFNRRYFDRRLEQELQRSRRERHPCSVLMIDADDFKLVNDRHGHPIGDLALKGLADVLRDVLRATDDVTSRLGGEEFAVILPNTDKAGALRAAERARDRVALHRVQHPGGSLQVTVSVGVCTFDPADPCTADELVARADGALYRAKAAGKNAVRAHSVLEANAFDEGITRAEKEGLR
jgi:two-component system chemotaxis family response regulator WspR